MAGKTILGKELPDNSADTWGIKNFTEIALPRTVSEINTFLHFTQTQDGCQKWWENNFRENSSDDSAEIPWRSKISLKSLYLTPFPR